MRVGAVCGLCRLGLGVLRRSAASSSPGAPVSATAAGALQRSKRGGCGAARLWTCARANSIIRSAAQLKQRPWLLPHAGLHHERPCAAQPWSQGKAKAVLLRVNNSLLSRGRSLLSRLCPGLWHTSCWAVLPAEKASVALPMSKQRVEAATPRRDAGCVCCQQRATSGVCGPAMGSCRPWSSACVGCSNYMDAS